MSAPIYSSPVIVWGTSEDFSLWSQTGTVTATSGQTDPFNGSTGYVLDDNDAGTAEARYKEYTAAVKGYHVWTVCSKYYSAATSAVKFENTTLGLSGTASYAWSAFEATLTASGAGTVLTPAWVGGYYIQRIAVYAVAGNTMRMTLYPAGTTAGDTGATYFYQNDLTLLGTPDQLVSWEEPREGSAWAQSGSGAEDAWIQGTDYRMTVTLPWIPFLDRSVPEAVSGWNGPREYNGVNSGISAMLRHGRTKGTLTWYPTLYGIASSTATAVACYLVDPMRGAPTLQPNGDRSVTLELRNATTPFKPYETV